MIRALCWKEYREHRTIWLLISGLTVLLVLGLGSALAPVAFAQAEDCKLCREDYQACVKAHSQGACKTNYDICLKHCRRK